MTINNVLNICKYCKHFLDSGKTRDRYLCLKHKAAIYKSFKCKKLYKVFNEAKTVSKVSKTAIDEAFAALTGKGWDS
jgi:GT2 family glycosyltransferase